MRCKNTLLLVATAASLAACTDEAVSPTATLEPRLSATPSGSADGAGTYLVRFKGSGIPAGFAEKVQALGGEVIFAHKIGIAAVAGLSADGADGLARSSSIASVDPDGYTVLSPMPDAVVESASSIESPDAPQTALRFNRQWNMKTIQADVAWAAGKKGSPDVRIGIIDTGIDYLYPDLVNLVDMGLSRSFLSDAENQRVIDTFGPGTPLWVDLHYHGSHVASTAVSNAYIYAGVTSKTKLVALRVCSPGTAPSFNASCPTSAVLNAVLYAADNGIQIVNLSLGGYVDKRDISAKGGFGPSFVATVNQVMNYASRNGTTVIVSAGNGNPATGIGINLDSDKNSFKAYCSAATVVCVSATAPTSQASVTGPWANIDALTGYSNYGRSAISVAAPGGGNGIFVNAACSGFTVITGFLVCRTRTYVSPTNWSGFSLGSSGTSMASPHVAGVAALIVANGVTDPGAVRALLAETADDLGQPGTDPAYGKGRVNAARAAGAI